MTGALILGLSWAWLIALDAVLSVLLLGLAVLLAGKLLDRHRARLLAAGVPSFERAERAGRRAPRRARRPLGPTRRPRPEPWKPHRRKGLL